MVTLNNRQIDIINFLSNQNTHITIKNISKMFDISERTIRSDLDSIQDALKEYNVSLERKPRVGVKLNFDQGEIEKFLNMHENKIYSAQERVLFVLIIIMTKEKTTFEELAEKLQVSKNTIIQDLKSAEILLEKYDIKIKKNPIMEYYPREMKMKSEANRICYLS